MKEGCLQKVSFAQAFFIFRFFAASRDEWAQLHFALSTLSRFAFMRPVSVLRHKFAVGLLPPYFLLKQTLLS